VFDNLSFTNPSLCSFFWGGEGVLGGRFLVFGWVFLGLFGVGGFVVAFRVF